MSKPLLALLTLALITTAVPVTTRASETTEIPKIRPSAEELGQVPTFSRMSLSPSGAWFATFLDLRGQRTLVIENLDNKAIAPFPVSSEKWRLNWYRWLSDQRMLVSVSVPSANSGTPITVTRLVLVDPAKRNIKIMFERDTNRFNFQIQDRVVSLLPDDPDAILVAFNPDNPAKPQVRRARLNRLRLSKNKVQTHISGIHGWRADVSGDVRVGYGFTADQRLPLLKMKDATGKWLNFPERAANAGFEVLGLPANNPNIVYVSSDHEHPLGALYEFNIIENTFGAKLAFNKRSAIASIELNDAGDAISVVNFESELVPTLYLDPWLKRFNKHLSSLLPKTTNRLISVSKDRERAIIRSYASDDPPHYYLYRAKLKSISYLNSQYPQLAERALASTELTTYKARDGLEIPAYVTLPSGHDTSSAKNLPFVVLPHGGPHARNFLRFDWLAQLIASRGYGVLQMNFRGSTGYGADFFEAGAKQWGQAMQDDITDGTHWLIEQGLANPQKICIAGGSYGGYAALMGLVKEPQLYQCGISLNGVTDLVTLLSSSSRYIGGRFSTRFIGNLWRDRTSLKENSPARHASKIEAPILLVQGEKDRVVNRRQAIRMQKALNKAGKTFEYIELPDGDHFLSRETNRLEFTRAAVAFLAQHLGEPDS